MDTEVKSKNFIEKIIDEDLANGTYKKVVTRFPPEPNGYLHIGHAKSILLNYGLAKEYGGDFHLRFDDTNAKKENTEYVESIIKDVEWLGAKYVGGVRYASNYFDQMYELAVKLIKKGKAYVDDLTADEIREYRGTLTEPGKNSPYRDRSIEENLDLFERMKNDEFKDGEKVLRAKIDMASPNINMRDPIIYRVAHVTHHNTGDKWCIYPMYDFAHPIEDAIEFMDFGLIKNEDNTFSLKDYQEANLGGIEADRFDNAAGILERFAQSTYFEDYFYRDAEQSVSYDVQQGKFQLAEGTKIPSECDSAETWLKFLESNHLEEEYKDVYEISRLICDEETKNINLDNITHDDAQFRLLWDDNQLKNVLETDLILNEENKPAIEARLELSEYAEAMLADYSGLLYDNGVETYQQLMKNEPESWINVYAEIDEDKNVRLNVTLDRETADGDTYTVRNIPQDMKDSIIERVEIKLEKENSSIKNKIQNFQQTVDELTQ